MLAVPAEAPEVAAFLATPPVRHDHPLGCRCSYHRRQREIREWDGPTPDDHDLED
jgi:hypothetical protein